MKVNFPTSCYNRSKNVYVSRQSLRTLRQRWMYARSGFLWLTDEVRQFNVCMVTNHNALCLYYHLGDKCLHCIAGDSLQKFVECQLCFFYSVCVSGTMDHSVLSSYIYRLPVYIHSIVFSQRSLGLEISQHVSTTLRRYF